LLKLRIGGGDLVDLKEYGWRM